MASNSPKYQVHLFEYEYDGRVCDLRLNCRSVEDAKARIEALSTTRYVGELMYELEVPKRRGIWWAWWYRRALAFLKQARSS